MGFSYEKLGEENGDFLKKLENCDICPRNCKVNRYEGKRGYCGQSSEVVIARAALHYWEEPCISGDKGSGAVFFSGCPMRCVFCQNRDIALGQIGKRVDIDRLVDIYFELEEKGALNLNLVTPTHYTYQIIESLTRAKNKGLSLKVVYNTSGYEKVETLKDLEGLVDVYLPDFKYYDSEVAEKYSNAPDYFEVADKAVSEMLRQVGTPSFDNCGIIEKGVIVRHLVLPLEIRNSKNVINHLYSKYGDDIFISIMSQYTPMADIDSNKYPNLARRITKREYNKVVDYALEIGVKNAFIQEGNVAKESFIPEFDLEGV